MPAGWGILGWGEYWVHWRFLVYCQKWTVFTCRSKLCHHGTEGPGTTLLISSTLDPWESRQVLIPLLVELDNLSLEGHLHVERPFVGVDCPQLLGQLLLLQTFLHDIKVVLDRFLLMGDGGILLCLV